MSKVIPESYIPTYIISLMVGGREFVSSANQEKITEVKHESST